MTIHIGAVNEEIDKAIFLYIDRNFVKPKCPFDEKARRIDKNFKV